MLRIALLILLVAGTTGLTGCGSGGPPAKPQRDTFLPDEKDLLEDMKSLLEGAKAAKRNPPSNNAEIQQYDAMNPSAAAAIAQGTIKYFYGQGLSTGNKIVAHGAKCETEGGWVLLQDGTVKQMSAEEFKAAPKAK
jgi:hypothetical protein